MQKNRCQVFLKPKRNASMAGIVGLIKAKPLKPVINAIENNPYGMATKFPEEPDRLFDGELKLLLMDGYSNLASLTVT